MVIRHAEDVRCLESAYVRMCVRGMLGVVYIKWSLALNDGRVESN